MYDISVLEYKQMIGRAGRPQYDPYGEAILLAGVKDEKDYLTEKYINSEPERLDSRLAQESALRSHVLSAIASEYAHSESELLEFLGHTFFGFNNHSNSIKFIISPTLRFLSKEKMIEENKGRLSATPLGHRISELYIDPVSAVIIKEGLMNKVEKITPFTWLHLISRIPDMKPIFRLNNSEFEEIANEYKFRCDELAIKIKGDLDWIDNQQELSYIKTATVLEAWINEKTENDILEKYGVQPGDRYGAVKNADWLLYSIHEISDILNMKDNKKSIDKLRQRVKYGIREELLTFIQLKNIGRIRARILYKHGIKEMDDLKRIPLHRLVELLGPSTAKSVKEQIGGLVEEEEWRSLDKAEKEQRALTDFVEKFEPEKDED
jgi:helicase